MQFITLFFNVLMPDINVVDLDMYVNDEIFHYLLCQIIESDDNAAGFAGHSVHLHPIV